MKGEKIMTNGEEIIYMKPGKALETIRKEANKAIEGNVLAVEGWVENIRESDRNLFYILRSDGKDRGKLCLMLPKIFSDWLDNVEIGDHIRLNVHLFFGTRDDRSELDVYGLIKKDYDLKIIKDVESPMQKEEKQLEQAKEIRAERRKKNVFWSLAFPIFKRRRPKIALLMPLNSVARSDIESGLGLAKFFYNITEERVNFSVPKDIADALRRLDLQQFDAICLARGGGGGLEKADNEEVWMALSRMKTPIINGMGHEDDTLRLRELSDKVKATPHGLGTYLRETAMKIIGIPILIILAIGLIIRIFY